MLTNTHLKKRKIRRGRYREHGKERDQSPRLPGVLPVPLSMQLPIQTGVSAPTFAVGDGIEFLCVSLIA